MIRAPASTMVWLAGLATEAPWPEQVSRLV